MKLKKISVSHGSTVRSPKAQKAYRKHRKNNPLHEQCDFCEFTIMSPQVVAEHPHFWHVRNIFPYSVWDECRVIEHTMIVPKRHVISLSELTDEESIEYTKLIGQLEAKGCNIYSRSDASATKSVPHQHTHAIKTNGKRLKFLHFNSTPHILLYR